MFNTFDELMRFMNATEEEQWICLQFLCTLKLRKIWMSQATQQATQSGEGEGK
jgi:hypothetical protein